MKGDGDPATSGGIFAFDRRSPRPQVGDLVEMNDVVVEFIPGDAAMGNPSITELTFPNITVISSGNPLPEPIVIGQSGRIPPAVFVVSEDELPVNLQDASEDAANLFDPEHDGLDFYESLEGMRVTVESPVAVSAIRAFSPFSSDFLTLANGGAGVEPPDARTARGGISLQPDPDNRGDQNPERVQIQIDPTLYPFKRPVVKVSDELSEVTGVVSYSFGNFEVFATEEFTVDPSALAPEVTELRSGRDAVTVASDNVLNLSPDASDDGQRAIVAGHIALNLGPPDIVALQEIQDDIGETDDGTSAGVPGGNIRNAFLYDPDKVSLRSFRALTADVLEEAGVADPDAFAGTRLPLEGSFSVRGGPGFITILNNHFSSRFGSTPVFGAIQPFVQAAEADREAQARALNQYVGSRNQAEQDRMIVVGDLNTFEFTDDLTEILPAGGILENLIPTLTDDNVYTFNFEGNSQVLDHIFMAPRLAAAAEFDIVHVKVDFPRLDDPIGSDHEPLVARIGLRGEGGQE